MGSFEGAGEGDDAEAEVEVELVVSKNGGLHLKASDAEEAKVLEAEAREARLDEGNILEAESSLREGLSLNYEVTVSHIRFPSLPFPIKCYMLTNQMLYADMI